jgi:hypothetical protein
MALKEGISPFRLGLLGLFDKPDRAVEDFAAVVADGDAVGAELYGGGRLAKGSVE